MTERQTILELKNLVFETGGKRILNGLSMDFWAGHIHALVGPNGAGKSTLAGVIMGLAEYTGYRGQVLLDGKPLEGVPIDERARRGIALAWQEPARFEGLTVQTFIEAAARHKGQEQIAAVMQQVGLDPEKYLKRAVDRTLSGGERKRIELASIIAMEPRVFLMDEPDSGIDINALDHIFDALKMLKEQGTTVILITHSPAVLRQAEHAFLICCGQLIDKGTIDHIQPYFEDKCIPCDHQNQPAVIETGDHT